MGSTSDTRSSSNPLRSRPGDDRRDPSRPSENPDPITGEPGAHPVGVGLGAAGGAAAGAAIGSVAGPVGSAVGAAAGGVAGGLLGKGIAEAFDPTAELDYWRDAHAGRPYAAGRRFSDLEPAYRVAIDSYQTSPSPVPFSHVEPKLRASYESARSSNLLDWGTARDASKDAWERIAERNREVATGAQKNAADQANDVLQMINDSIEGFHAAADRLQDSVYAAACRRYAAERQRLADELRPIIAGNGRVPTSSTEIRGALARAWMAVRNALGGGDRAIIENIESAEDHAVETYQRALASDKLTPECREALYRQYSVVKASHDQFSAWKKQFASAD